MEPRVMQRSESGAAAIVAKWEARRADPIGARALVPLSAVVDEVLSDLREIQRAEDDVLSVKAASLLGGYSEDHIRREIAAGHIANAGRKNKPALRRGDVPRKPGHCAPLPTETAVPQLGLRRRIALDASPTPPPRSA